MLESAEAYLTVQDIDLFQSLVVKTTKLSTIAIV